MSMYATIKFVLTLTCEESSRLLSASIDRELSPSERTAIGFHAFVCRFCRRYRRQIKFLRDAVRNRSTELFSATESGGLSEKLSPEARERIRSVLTRGDHV